MAQITVRSATDGVRHMLQRREDTTTRVIVMAVGIVIGIFVFVAIFTTIFCVIGSRRKKRREARERAALPFIASPTMEKAPRTWRDYLPSWGKKPAVDDIEVQRANLIRKSLESRSESRSGMYATRGISPTNDEEPDVEEPHGHERVPLNQQQHDAQPHRESWGQGYSHQRNLSVEDAHMYGGSQYGPHGSGMPPSSRSASPPWAASRETSMPRKPLPSAPSGRMEDPQVTTMGGATYGRINNNDNSMF